MCTITVYIGCFCSKKMKKLRFLVEVDKPEALRFTLHVYFVVRVLNRVRALSFDNRIVLHHIFLLHKSFSLFSVCFVT